MNRIVPIQRLLPGQLDIEPSPPFVEVARLQRRMDAGGDRVAEPKRQRIGTPAKGSRRFRAGFTQRPRKPFA
jgi:hypothetical protein